MKISRHMCEIIGSVLLLRVSYSVSPQLLIWSYILSGLSSQDLRYNSMKDKETEAGLCYYNSTTHYTKFVLRHRYTYHFMSKSSGPDVQVWTESKCNPSSVFAGITRSIVLIRFYGLFEIEFPPFMDHSFTTLMMH